MEISQGELTDQILSLLKELDPGLNAMKIQAESPLQTQVGLSTMEFKKLNGMIFDLYGIHLPPEAISPSSSLMDLVDAVRNSSLRKEP